MTPINLPAESYATAIATRVQGGNAPDTFNAEGGTGQANSIIPFAKAGLLLPLTDNEIKRNLPSNEKYLWTYNGKIYGVPLGTQVNGVIYNDELAKSIGVNIDASTSLDDIIAQCSVARAKGKTIYALAGSVPGQSGDPRGRHRDLDRVWTRQELEREAREEQDHVRGNPGVGRRTHLHREDVQGRLLPGRRGQRRL